MGAGGRSLAAGTRRDGRRDEWTVETGWRTAVVRPCGRPGLAEKSAEAAATLKWGSEQESRVTAPPHRFPLCPVGLGGSLVAHGTLTDWFPCLFLKALLGPCCSNWLQAGPARGTDRTEKSICKLHRNPIFAVFSQK